MKMIGFISFFIISQLLLTLSTISNAGPVADKIALLDFINNIHHTKPLNWYKTPHVCTQWTGVTCSSDHSRVIALRLPGLGLTGPIPPNTLSRLTSIQTLSLRSNAITGPFPVELAKFNNLTALYLQSNKFTGDLPLDLLSSKNISVIDFSYNRFTGSIPLSSLSNLTQLTVLNLAHNNLSGEVTDLRSLSLQVLNLSYNNLTGTLPQSLKRFPMSAFIGNNIIMFDSPSPLSPALPPSIVSPIHHVLLGVILGCVILLFAVIALFIIFRRSKKASLPVNYSMKNITGCAKKGVSESQNKGNKLIFFDDCNLAFDLEDLLRASAEVLGKGTFGTTYKAALEDTSTIVVKRLRSETSVVVGKREFEEQMELVGNVRHENVVSLRAYYYSKEEKLMIYDYFSTGSVSAMLHGRRTGGVHAFDWETRLRVAVGAARGISHIHSTNGGKQVHGNIKSSNVFTNSDGHGCVCDLGLATLIINSTHSPIARATAFQAPEVTDTRKVTQASDVYGYGVLLLELLTGKSPTCSLGGGGGNEVVHLVRWVNSVVREEWTAEVFDVGLLRYPNIEEELVELLQVGLSCTVRMPEERPKMVEVVKMVEDIGRMNTRPSSVGIKSELSTPQQVERGSSSAAK